MKQTGKWLVTFFASLLIVSLFFGAKYVVDEINKLALGPQNLILDYQLRYGVFGKGTYQPNEYPRFKKELDPSPLNSTQIPFGEVDVWYQLDLRNSSPEALDITILFDNLMLDTIDIYQVKNNELVLINELGDKRKAKRLIDFALPHQSVQLVSNERIQLVLKTSSLGTPNMPIAIFESINFKKYKDSLLLIWGSFVGIVLLMAVYNVILYLGVKDVLYLIYVVYVSAFLIVLGIVHGFLIYLIPFELFDVLADRIIVFFCIVGITMLAFAVKFLKYDVKNNNKLFKFGLGLGGAILVLAVYAMFAPEYKAAQIFFMLQGFVYLFAILLVALRLKNDFSWTKFYVVSWLPLFVGAAVGPLMLTGNLEYNFWTRHALLFGVIFEMTFISMALAERLRTSEGLRLYQATHDQFLDIANSVLINNKLASKYESEFSPSFSLVTLKIENFHRMTPYLNEEKLKSILYKFLAELEKFLLKRVTLEELAPNAKVKHIAALREGQYAFIVLSSDQTLLQQLKTEFTKFVPFSYRLPGLNISFNCFCHCVSAQLFDGPNDLIQFSTQKLSELQRLKQFFYVSTSKNSERSKLHNLLEIKDHEELLEKMSFRPVLVSSSNTLKCVWVKDHLLPLIGPNTLHFDSADKYSRGDLYTYYLRLFSSTCELIKQKGNSKCKLIFDISLLEQLNKNFISELVKSISGEGLHADRFVFKIGNNLLKTDYLTQLMLLNELTDLGFGLCLDEYSIGLANVKWLNEIELKFVVISMHSLNRLNQSGKSGIVLSEFLNILRELNFEIIVDEVNKKTDLTALSEGEMCIAGKAVQSDLEYSQLEEYLDREVFDDLVNSNQADLEREQAVSNKRHFKPHRTPNGLGG